MNRISVEELERELAATDEAYVQRKLLLGYYDPAHVVYVKAWLAQRDGERVRLHAARDLAVSKRTAFWTMVGAWGSVGAVIVALIVSKLG